MRDRPAGVPIRAAPTLVYDAEDRVAAYLKLTAAAEALAGKLDAAQMARSCYTVFADEVSAGRSDAVRSAGRSDEVSRRDLFSGLIYEYRAMAA